MSFLQPLSSQIFLGKQFKALVLAMLCAPLALFGQEAESIVRPKVGLVLSGGGAKGFAHIGVLKTIDSLGIPVDYIGGTSMGGIVAAMYSIGYSPEQMERIVKDSDWDMLMNDVVLRSSYNINQKEVNARYALKLPLKKDKSLIPSGVLKGQNISLLLSELTMDFHGIQDFSQLPIPFICTGANIETGESVVFTSGNLTDALRATMSIPTAFEPYEIDGSLYVDGGLFNNLPVEEVKAMGADIIISVDVQTPYYEREELGSFITILDQASKFLRAPKYDEALAQTDILIRPDISDINLNSFNQGAKIITRGEEAVKPAYPALLELSKRMKEYEQPITRPERTRADSFSVDRISVKGLKSFDSSVVLSRMNLELGQCVSFHDLKRDLNRLYATGFFEKVSYQILKDSYGNNLELQVLESETEGIARIGAHYDLDFNVALLLGYSLPNIGRPGSELNLDLRLGQIPCFSVEYLLDRGWKPGLLARAEISQNQLIRYNDDNPTARLNTTDILFSLSTQSVAFNDFAFRVGAEFELFDFGSQISLVQFEEPFKVLFNYYASFKLDTYNQVIYPTKGVHFDGLFKVITDHRVYQKLKSISPASFVRYHYSFAAAINPKLTLRPEAYGVNVFGSTPELPAIYDVYMGGFGQSYQKNVLPFYGLLYSQRRGTQAIALAMKLQLELKKDLYLLGTANAGGSAFEFKEITNAGNRVFGTALTLGYRSFLGPIEISVAGSDQVGGLQGYFNLGFWF